MSLDLFSLAPTMLLMSAVMDPVLCYPSTAPTSNPVDPIKCNVQTEHVPTLTMSASTQRPPVLWVVP